MISDPVHVQIRFQAGAPAYFRNVRAERRLRVIIVPGRLAVDDDRLARRRRPTIQHLLVVAAAMIVVADASVRQNFRQVDAVAEGVRLEVEIQAVGVKIEQSRQITLRIQQMTG